MSSQTTASAAWTRPRGPTTEDRVEIDAPAELVWEYLADIAGWRRWNPVYPDSRGRPAVDETIAITVALPGMKPQRATARIEHCAPPHVLVFGTAVLGGLMRATRYFVLEQRGPRGCALLNGEIFGGIIAPLLLKKIGPPVREGLIGSSKGLKALAEAEWRARSSAQP